MIDELFKLEVTFKVLRLSPEEIRKRRKMMNKLYYF